MEHEKDTNLKFQRFFSFWQKWFLIISFMISHFLTILCSTQRQINLPCTECFLPFSLKLCGIFTWTKIIILISLYATNIQSSFNFNTWFIKDPPPNPHCVLPNWFQIDRFYDLLQKYSYSLFWLWQMVVYDSVWWGGV